MKKALISILIPAFNHEDYIEECIESVINQTYDRIELIIINDGSTDKTGIKIKELSNRIKMRVEKYLYIERENRGTAITCRELITAANGDYLIFLSSDDLFKKNTLEKLESFLAENKDYGFVVGDNDIISRNSKRVFWNKKRKPGITEEFKFKTFSEYLKSKRKDVNFDSDDFGTYKTLLKGNYITNGFLIRKEIIDRIDAYNKNAPVEDWYLMLQISKITKMKYIDEVLLSYRWHEYNAIKNKELLKNYAHKTISLEVMNILSNNKNQNFQDMVEFLRNNKFKSILKINKIFHLYQIKNCVFKRLLVSIYNFEIVLKSEYSKEFYNFKKYFN